MYNTLAIINKGLIERKKNVLLPNNNNALIFSKILYKQGVINNYNILFNNIILYFNIYENKLLFNKLKYYKKLNLNKYVTYKKLKKMVFLQKKRFLLTTIVGIISSELALKYKIGGCILVEFI